MTGLYIFVALAVIALVGWGVAELKYKSIHFTHSEAEREEAELLEKENYVWARQGLPAQTHGTDNPFQ